MYIAGVPIRIHNNDIMLYVLINGSLGDSIAQLAAEGLNKV